jgi:hypothetical protein
MVYHGGKNGFCRLMLVNDLLNGVGVVVGQDHFFHEQISRKNCGFKPGISKIKTKGGHRSVLG